MGVLVLEEEDEKNLDLGMAGIYITVIAWTMVGIGALYFLMVSGPCVSSFRLRFFLCQTVQTPLIQAVFFTSRMRHGS